MSHAAASAGIIPAGGRPASAGPAAARLYHVAENHPHDRVDGVCEVRPGDLRDARPADPPRPGRLRSGSTAATARSAGEQREGSPAAALNVALSIGLSAARSRDCPPPRCTDSPGVAPRARPASTAARKRCSSARPTPRPPAAWCRTRCRHSVGSPRRPPLSRLMVMADQPCSEVICQAASRMRLAGTSRLDEVDLLADPCGQGTPSRPGPRSTRCRVGTPRAGRRPSSYT